MQYDYSDLDRAIYYVLTLNPDKPMSKNEIIDKLNSENALGIHIFRGAQFDIDGYFNKCLDKMVKTYKNITVSDGKYVYNLKSTPKFDLKKIETIIKYPNQFPDIKFDTIYQHGQTILHILCMENRYDLLEKLDASFNLNFFVKNEIDQTVFDIIDTNINENEKTLMHKKLLKLVSKQLNEISTNYTSEIKTLNTILQNKNNTLVAKNNKLENDVAFYKRISQFMVMLWLVFIFTFIH